MKPSLLCAGLALSVFASQPVSAQSGASLALQLDGVNDSAQAAHRSEFNAYPLTITAWIKTGQNSNIAAGIVGKYVSGSSNGYQLFTYAGRVRAWYFRNSANHLMKGTLGLDGGPVADGLWHHVAFVVDQSGARLYVDGIHRDTVNWTGTPGPCTTTTALRIGLYDIHLSGQIDEVTFWTSALTAGEVAWFRDKALRGREPGLLRYYRFNTGSGSSLMNDAGLSFVGENILGSPAWVESTAPVLASGPDRALTLNSAFGYSVSVPHNAALNVYPLAITCWLRTSQSNSAQSGIVGKYESGSGDGYQLFLKDGRVRAWYYRNPSNFIQDATGDGVDGGFIADGNWHHVAFVVTVLGGQIYVDRSLRGSKPWTGIPGPPTTAAPLLLGRYASSFLHGSLDDVTLWNRDLRGLPFGTNSLTGSESGLRGYWRLDEWSGMATDSSPFSHTGTITSSGVPEMSSAPYDPPVPFTRPAASIGHTTAELRGTVLPQVHGQPFQSWFQWGPTTSYGNQTAPVAGSGTANVPLTSVLSTLNPSQTYHYRMVVQKATNTTFGADHVFITLTLPLPIVTTLAALSVTGTNALLRSTINPQGVPDTASWFDWGATTNLGSRTPRRFLGFTNTFNFSEALQLLSPLQTYYFRAAASNAAGQAFGSIQSFTTAGTVFRFSNLDPVLGIDAPFFDEPGLTLLEGATYRAALYVGGVTNSPDTFFQVGPSQPFQNAPFAGYWVPEDVVPPMFPPFLAQVRFWDTAFGATFEDAAATNGRIGLSAVLLVSSNGNFAARGGIMTVTVLTDQGLSGLQSSSLIPAVLTVSRGAGSLHDDMLVGSGQQLNPFCGAQVGINRWFRFTNAVPGEMVFDTQGSSVDTVLGLFSGSITAPQMILCNDDDHGQPASLVRYPNGLVNTLYQVCVARKGTASGDMQLNYSIITRLDIRKLPNGLVELSWPADAFNWLLESTVDVGLPNSWVPSTFSHTIQNNRTIVTVNPSGDERYFRLHKP